MEITEKRIFYINSSSTDFTQILDLNGIQPSHVSLLACNIPKSYYLITTNQNTFTLSEDVKTATVSIPIGNYTRRSLQTVLTTQLNASSPNGYTYAISSPSVSNSAETGKYTFTVSGNGGIQPIFTFSDYTGVAESMGFNINSSYQFTTDSLQSANVVKLLKEDTLFIHSNICQSENKTDVLQQIFVNSQVNFGSINWENTNIEYYKKPLLTNGSNNFSFRLTDENDKLIDLNGQNFQMVIVVFKQENKLLNWNKDILRSRIS